MSKNRHFHQCICTMHRLHAHQALDYCLECARELHAAAIRETLEQFNEPSRPEHAEEDEESAVPLARDPPQRVWWVVNAYGKWRLEMHTVVKTYATDDQYRFDARRMALDGWTVVNVVQEKRPPGCERIGCCGLFALLIPPRPVLVVTYQRE